MPTDVGIVDLMLSIPTGNEKDWYEFLKPQLREESKDYEFPAQYMFKEVPHLDEGVDHVAATLGLMDQYGIERRPGEPVSEHQTELEFMGHEIRA